MLPLGTAMPSFSLTNAVDGTPWSSAKTAGAKGTLVMFICNHCPYVVHIRAKLVEVAHHAVDLGFAVVAINANSLASHPQDGPGPMKELALREAWRFPFLFDDTQDVARAFDAACTPDLYVFDGAGKLAYRGQFDAARPGNGKPVTGADLRAAIDAVAEGKPVATDQRASIGCNIKWAR
jgi:thiol-disulfide isomerase/thioredoxin